MSDVSQLLDCRVVAVVGASTNPEKAGHFVPLLLLQRGYNVIPINPNASKLFGEPAYKTLSAMPGKERELVELVEVFRKPVFVKELAGEILRLLPEMKSLRGVWLQDGITDPVSEDKLRAAGLIVVSNNCMKRELEKL